MSVKVLVLSSALLAAGCVSAVPDNDTCGCPYKQQARAASDSSSRAEAAQSADEEAADERDPELFAARSEGDSVVSVHVDEQYITGPGVSLGRYDEEEGRAFRGTADGNVVDLRIEESRVSGAIDSSPVDLQVERDGTSLQVNGLLAGRVSRFRVDEQGMKGKVGTCSYDLSRAANGFIGRRSCSSEMHDFTLAMPDTMASWTDADIAAVFAVFLR